MLSDFFYFVSLDENMCLKTAVVLDYRFLIKKMKEMH